MNIAETSGREVPRLRRIDKPIKGPTGAKIVGYEWRSKLIEDVDSRGNERIRRVSDWDDHDTSEGTGRSIVHTFYVEHPDGRITVEGRNSAQNVLGIDQSRLKTIAKNEQAAQKYKAEHSAREAAKIEKLAKGTTQEAARDFRMRGGSPASEADFMASLLFEKDGKYYRAAPFRRDDLEPHGWRVIKRGLTPIEE